MEPKELSDHDLLMQISATVARIDKSLFGNGQPGLIHELQADIGDLKATRERMRGARWILGLLGTTVWGVAEYLFHHR